MPKNAADRVMLVRLLGAARIRLNVVHGTSQEFAAQAAFNRAVRMLDAYDSYPDDETPSVVVKYLWRPWETREERTG